MDEITDGVAENKNHGNRDSGDKARVSKGILITAVVVITVILVLFFGLKTYEDSQKQYINGNILNLGALGDGQIDSQRVLNPWLANTIHSNFLYRTLFNTNADADMVWGDIAEDEFGMSEDGKVYTINLKDNLYWSDGTPITGQDVVFSFTQLLLAANVNGVYTSALDYISGVDEFKVDNSVGISGLQCTDDTVTITLKQVYTPFTLVLSQIVILPEHCFTQDDLDSGISEADYWSNPVVSGMYYFAGVVDNGPEDRYARLLINENYSGDLPKIEEVRIIGTTDITPLDYYNTTDIKEMVELSFDTHYTKYPSRQTFYKYFYFNISGSDGFVNEAMSDLRVREAIYHAIDIDWIYTSVFYEEGNKIYSGVPTTAQSYIGNTHEYNPEKAKALLEEAGYDFDRPFTIAYYYSDEISLYFIEEVTEYLTDIGLTVESFKTTNTTQELYYDREYDMAYKGLTAFLLEEWYNEFLPTHATLSHNLYNLEFLPLAQKLGAAVTLDEYSDVLRELQNLELETRYKIPIYSANVAVYINTSRVDVPDDIAFGNTRYRSDLQLDKWEIKKE